MLHDEIDLVNEFERIHHQASEKGLVLRLIGALAFWVKCPKYNYLHAILKREYTDIDFIAPYRQKYELEKFFNSLGFINDHSLSAIPGIKRSIFHSQQPRYHVDVFYDELDMCHLLDLKGRLQFDSITISITDLLLEKGQIVKINNKDLIDMIMLLAEYLPVEGDEKTVNISRIVNLCQHDWGWWHTLRMNLQKVNELAQSGLEIPSEAVGQVGERVEMICKAMDDVPKSFAWKVRAKIGDRKKWYKEVEEINN
jgi:hypothetical protein